MPGYYQDEKDLSTKNGELFPLNRFADEVCLNEKKKESGIIGLIVNPWPRVYDTGLISALICIEKWTIKDPL